MPFVLESATPADIPQLVAIYLASFADAFSITLFPRTPAITAWWTQDLETGFADPHTHFVKAIDSDSGRVIAFAKWVFPPKEQGESGEKQEPEELPAWPAGSDSELLNGFFGGLLARKHELMHGRRYFYLEMLGTLPEFQGRGAGKQLIKWGTDQADLAKLPSYLDGSPVGVPLYGRCGFVVHGEVIPPTGVEEDKYLCMIREHKD